jgi:hypothetical protein
MGIRFHKRISRTSLAVCVCACLLIHANAIKAQNSHRQMNGDRRQGCPVTKAADAFVPPSPYKNTTSGSSFFFRTQKLWTLVRPSSWAGRKLVWWSPGNDMNTDTPPGLTITFKRLDATAHSGRPTMRIGHLSTASPRSLRRESIRLPRQAAGRLPGVWQAKR